ncbi:flagellar motor stator protein MotA [Photobacterium sp. BZF1]|uniref:flagellar motor stator protein MotA n=1 Tax=Photobacterium sp. BZF1 TaxID=1904457 RepID=UPI001653B86B|nr:flagellar motor stator protein MotA [Photobacterium sp. BZF1]MBC7001623.1 flagellar motor stator protein MotA [Photobacterium sp. BZF1]
MQKIIGVIVVFSVIFGGFIFLGGKIEFIFKISEIIIIFGSALASLLMSTTSGTLKLMVQQIGLAFKKTPYDKEYYQQLLSLMFELINIAKVQNIKALDIHVENPDSSRVFAKYPKVTKDALTLQFIIDSFRQVITGKQSQHVLEAFLEEEIEHLEDEYIKPSEKLHATAEAMPGLGILAAVMGIILTMQGLDGEITEIGKNIAGALVGTFTGVFGCYCVLGPMSSSIKDIAESQVTPLHCIKSILSAHAQGQSSHMCANAGRKNIETRYKPSFDELEKAVEVLRQQPTSS